MKDLKESPPVCLKNSYMAFNIQALKLCLLWPLNTQNPVALFCHRLLTWFTIFALAFTSIGQVLKIYYSLDLAELSSTVDTLTLTASALYKMVYLLINLKTMKKMVKVVHNSFDEAPLLGIKKFRMQSYIQRTYLLTFLYIISGQIATTFWCFAPLMFTPLVPISDPNAPLTVKNRRTMPINMWLPINIAESPTYEVMFVIESFAYYTSALLYLTIDSFYFFLIYVIVGQLKLVDASFKTLFDIDERLRREEDGFKTEEATVGNNDTFHLGPQEEKKDIERIKDTRRLTRHRVLNQYLERTVDLHAIVLDLVREIEIFFSQAIVVDFLHAILSLSFALFQTQMSVTLVEACKMYVFIVVCIVHQFFNNLFGEFLIQAQHMVVNSVYESPWYTGDRRFKRTVQLVTTRSLRPIRLSGFKMYILCLESFLVFCRRIFSYYTVLSEVSKS